MSVINRFIGARVPFVLLIGVLAAPAVMAQWNPPNPVVSFHKLADGLEVQQKDGVLRLEVKSPEVLHLIYAPLGPAAPERASDWVVVKKDWPAAAFEVTSNEKVITLWTAKLKVVVERESGALHYIGTNRSEVTGAGSTGPAYAASC